jgi:hypothetical protein
MPKQLFFGLLILALACAPVVCTLAAQANPG